MCRRASQSESKMITTRLYLDARQSKEGAPAPLKLSITHKREVAYLPTGFKLVPSSWDPVALTAKDKATMLSISRFKLKVDTLLLDLLESGKLDGLSARGIRNLVARELSPNATASVRFMECLKDFASTRRKPRTREIYMETYKRITQFDRRWDVLEFQDITIGWLDRFDAFLSRTSPKKNARNIHLRNIKAVFNDAMKKELTLFYPFRNYEIRAEETAKRSLTAEQLRLLFTTEFPAWKQRYVDFFKISFMLIGANTEDLVHATEVAGGRFEYIRAKTYKPYSVKVEPECMELIEKYRGKDYLLDILDTYASTHNWTSRVDKVLKDVAAELGLPDSLSMYWTRHSWATIAGELDIPHDTLIAASLGHSKKTVTEIYIRFDRAKIDRANRRVLDYVLYNKKEDGIFEMIRSMNEKVSKLA